MEFIQSKKASHPLNNYLVEEKKLIMMNMNMWSKVEEQALRQKFRATWIAGGDATTEYFHVQWKMSYISLMPLVKYFLILCRWK